MAAHSPILFIENEPVMLGQLSGLLETEGFEVLGAASAREGISKLGKHGVSLVVTDLQLSGNNGLSVVKEAGVISPYSPVIVVADRASVPTAVEAMKRGAFHYLEKPFSPEALLLHLKKALEYGAALRDRAALKERLSSESGLGRILGESPAVLNLHKMIRDVADNDATVLISGETGTGKELVANALHFESGRAARPLVKVNCAALSETLMESELFGHEKGAFTGAERFRKGRFERSHTGTLLLDEITELNDHVQAKLLRALQGGEIERVGGDAAIHVDVRVVASTNRNPEEAVAEGKLRQDLFFRLNVVRIDVPPLRERREDIPLLARAFLSRYASTRGRTVRDFSPEALDALCRHSWPGNVRELENSVERAVLLARGETIDLAFLPIFPADGTDSHPLSARLPTFNLKEMERLTILSALDATGWNKTRAAGLLGIYPTGLYKRLKRLGIPLKRSE